MSRRAFFFPHSLEPAQKPGADNISGRVPFEVTGTLLGSELRQGPVLGDGRRIHRSARRARRAWSGSCQDPCVFSDPWGPFHAFLRLDGANLANEKVMGAGKVIADSLPETVESRRRHHLRQDEPERRQEHQGGLGRHRDGRRFDHDVAGPRGRQTAVHVLPRERSFAPRQGHGCLSLQPARCGDEGRPRDDATATRIASSAAASRRTRARSRSSRRASCRLPIVPAACVACSRSTRATWARHGDRSSSSSSRASSPRSKGIPRGGWIAEFASFALAEALLAAVVKRSGGHQGMRGTVAIPPLSPVGGTKRWNPRTARVFPG